MGEGAESPRIGGARGELRGLASACDAMAAGEAIVVPNPAPMAYGVVATSARAVNALKRRPLTRNVAISLHDPWRRGQTARVIDLPVTARDAVVALLRQRLTVLVPLRRRMPLPAWMRPAARDGYLAIFDGSWARTARLWKRFPVVYGSSANLTEQPPAATVAEAVAMFGPECPVIDGDAVRESASARRTSTMIRIDRVGRLDLHRSGAQDTASGLARAEYLRRLAASLGLPRDGHEPDVPPDDKTEE